MGTMALEHLYEEARLVLRVAAFMEVVFADDLNAFRQFPLSTPNEVAIETADSCQQNCTDGAALAKCNSIPKRSPCILYLSIAKPAATANSSD